MTEKMKTAVTEAVQKWKEHASERTERLLEHALSPGGRDPRFLRVLGPGLQTYQDTLSCAEYVLDELLRSIETTYCQHIAKPQDIVDLTLEEDHPRYWKRNSCRFTLDGLTFHVYTPTSSYGIAIGLGRGMVSRINKKMRAGDCAEVIRAMAEAYPLFGKAVEEIAAEYGKPHEAVRKLKLIREIERISSSSQEQT